jgi:hypothetical protein
MYRIEVDISNLFAEYVHGPVWWQRDGDIQTASIHADVWVLFGSILARNECGAYGARTRLNYRVKTLK